MEQLTFIIHVFSCFFMCGLCWFVQIIHYPLFRDIDPKDFALYEQKNLRTAFITGPMMLLELFTAAYLQYLSPNDPLLWIGSILIFVIWISTFVIQGPTHLKLTAGADEKLFKVLIRSNWIRTIGWTIRSLIMIYLLMSVNSCSITGMP